MMKVDVYGDVYESEVGDTEYKVSDAEIFLLILEAEENKNKNKEKDKKLNLGEIK